MSHSCVRGRSLLLLAATLLLSACATRPATFHGAFDQALRFGDEPRRGVVLYLHGCDGLGGTQLFTWAGDWIRYLTTRGFLVVAPNSFADPRPGQSCQLPYLRKERLFRSVPSRRPSPSSASAPRTQPPSCSCGGIPKAGAWRTSSRPRWTGLLPRATNADTGPPATRGSGRTFRCSPSWGRPIRPSARSSSSTARPLPTTCAEWSCRPRSGTPSSCRTWPMSQCSVAQVRDALSRFLDAIAP